MHYIEGCTAPQFSTASLHSAVVELIAMEGASIRYTTIQNWYRNIFNLVTKMRRRLQERDGGMGRRQHRLASDDEVSRDLLDGRGRARRDPLDIVIAGFWQWYPEWVRYSYARRAPSPT